MNEDLIEFVKKHTSQFDESHDYKHAIAVYKNALNIAKIEFPFYDNEILEYACMLHDVCDHKYEHSISKEDLNKYICKKLIPSKAKLVIDIINNISFSQEIKNKRQKLNTPYQDIVSDADKLEALGEVGLNRCIEFTKSRNGRIPEDVIIHCHEKLLRLKDEFIRTPTGKMMAETLHDYIVKYVQI